jgi:hypothetical protein
MADKSWEDIVNLDFNGINNFVVHLHKIPKDIDKNIRAKEGCLEQLTYVYFGPNFVRNPQESELELRRLMSHR